MITPNIPADALYIKEAIDLSRKEGRSVYVHRTNKGEIILLKDGQALSGGKLLGFALGIDWFPFI